MKKQDTHQIIIHAFVYEGDQDIILETILCAQQAMPSARIVVIDDANAPCPVKVQEKAQELGVEWRLSAWKRGGNLRGKECILGILDAMQQSASSPNDTLVKIDADTCLLRGESLEQFAAGDKVLWSSGYIDVRIYGCLYAIKSHALVKTRAYIESLSLEPNAPEDIIIGFSLMHVFPDASLYEIEAPRGSNNPEGAWTAYQWRDYPNVGRYQHLSVVTTGNRPSPPLTKKQRRPVMTALRLSAQKS